MAKRKKNKIDLKQWVETHGSDFTIKVRDGKPYISRKPKRDPARKKSDAEQKQVDLFRQAVDYAKEVIADDEKKEKYVEESGKTGRSIYHLAISDYIAENRKKQEDGGHKQLEFEEVVAEKSGDLVFLKINFSEPAPFKKLEVSLSELDKTPVESGTAEQAQKKSWWYLISNPDIAGLPFRAQITATTREDEVFEAEHVVV